MSTAALSLRPIESDLQSVLERAVAQRELTREIAAAARDRGVRRVIFTGVGGSWASSTPPTLQLGAAGAPFSAENINATEFTAHYLGGIDAQTLILASSHSGATPEAVAAAEAAAERGALVVSLAKDADNNPLARAASFSLAYGSERTVTSGKYALLSEFTYSMLEGYDVNADIAGARAALDAIPEATVEATEASEPRVAAIAKRYALEDQTYILAAGPQLGLAYLLSVCYLVEMQSKHTTHIAAADFFHGPFEAAIRNQPYILLAGEDASRPQLDRVRRFLDTYHDNYEVLDTADFALDGIAPEQRGNVAHIPQAAVVMRLAEHFEPITGIDLDGRRYMHRVEY